MAVRAVLRPVLALSRVLDRPASGLTVAQRRAASARGGCRRVGVAGGEIMVRSYRPGAAVGSQPAHLFLHGGSFWLGGVAEYDPLCRFYAATAGVVVVSVDYRLAPEHSYPTGVEDAYGALTWLVEHADELGVDPGRVLVGGFSAGGCLTAALTLMAGTGAGRRSTSRYWSRRSSTSP